MLVFSKSPTYVLLKEAKRLVFASALNGTTAFSRSGYESEMAYKPNVPNWVRCVLRSRRQQLQAVCGPPDTYPGQYLDLHRFLDETYQIHQTKRRACYPLGGAVAKKKIEQERRSIPKGVLELTQTKFLWAAKSAVGHSRYKQNVYSTLFCQRTFALVWVRVQSCLLSIMSLSSTAVHPWLGHFVRKIVSISDFGHILSF